MSLLICHTRSQLALLNSTLSVRSVEEVMSVTKTVPDVLSDLSARDPHFFLCVCLSGQSSVVRICCTVFF